MSNFCSDIIFITFQSSFESVVLLAGLLCTVLTTPCRYEREWKPKHQTFYQWEDRDKPTNSDKPAFASFYTTVGQIEHFADVLTSTEVASGYKHLWKRQETAHSSQKKLKRSIFTSHEVRTRYCKLWIASHLYLHQGWEMSFDPARQCNHRLLVNLFYFSKFSFFPAT